MVMGYGKLMTRLKLMKEDGAEIENSHYFWRHLLGKMKKRKELKGLKEGGKV